jgi:hypothetical protein
MVPRNNALRQKVIDGLGGGEIGPAVDAMVASFRDNLAKDKRGWKVSNLRRRLKRAAAEMDYAKKVTVWAVEHHELIFGRDEAMRARSFKLFESLDAFKANILADSIRLPKGGAANLRQRIIGSAHRLLAEDLARIFFERCSHGNREDFTDLYSDLCELGTGERPNDARIPREVYRLYRPLRVVTGT